MFATVRFSGEVGRPALLAPSEALVRTGKRTLVMLALGSGRYQPAEVRTGREANGETEILAGLREGEKVVASGQFLIDSEASLSGINRSEEHTSELQSLMRISYAVFCLKKKNNKIHKQNTTTITTNKK